MGYEAQEWAGTPVAARKQGVTNPAAAAKGLIEDKFPGSHAAAMAAEGSVS